MEPIFFDLEVGDESKRICLIDFPHSRTADPLTVLPVDRYTDHLEKTELVILRPAVDVPISKAGEYERVLVSLSRKTPRAEGYVLCSQNFKHQLARALVKGRHGNYSSQILDTMLNDIREQEFQHYVNSSDALLSARDGFVYRAPSGHYVRQFLRVGNIQKSRQALDAVFFWMLPFLEDCRAIIVDTWSISSIALNAARLLERYQGKMKCRVELLPTYFDGSPDSRTDAETLLRHTGQGAGSVLVLFSAVRSGRSLERLQEVFERIVPAEKIRYLALYGLLDEFSPIKALCNGLQGFETVPREGTVIAIDPGSFFPVTARDKPLLIRRDNSRANRSFFRYYKGSKAIRIHRNVHDSLGQTLRHHAFDIDVESLLTKPRFLKRFHQKLQGLKQPSIVVVPSHDTGNLLGEEAIKFLAANRGQSPQLIDHPDLDPQDQSLKKVFAKMDAQTEILILDDVSTTGQRLSRFQANLRARNFRGHLSYLVGVARPDDERVWSDRVRNLRPGEHGQQNDIECVEKIVLPNWRADECPWCMEYRWLSDMIRNGKLCRASLDLALARQRRLETAADGEGLVDEVLWIVPGQPRPTITRGSIFLPHVGATEADVVASVAGAIQRMRTDSEETRRLRADFPQPRLLSPSNYLGPSPRFNEPILRMAVLRSTRRSELRRWDDGDEAQRSTYLRDDFGDNQHSLALEMIVAISQRKFPLIVTEDSDANIESVRPSEVHEILLRVLEKQ